MSQSTDTFVPDVYVDVTRERYLAWLEAGKPVDGPNALPAGAIPISAAGLNRLGQALQVASQVAGAAATADALASAQTTLQAGINSKVTSTQAQAIAQAAIAAFVGSAPAELDTWPEVVAYLANLAATDTSVAGQITTLSQSITAKYTKPAGGIPAADLAAGVIPAAPDLTPYVTKTAADAAYVQRSEYVAGSVGAARGTDLSSDTALSLATPRLQRVNGGVPLVTGARDPAKTHYNWSVLRTAGVVANPVDAYYAWDSPDHGGAGTGGSGIRWYTAPHPAGPWTHRRADGTAIPVGQPYEYVYRDPVPDETETPVVFYWPQSDGKNLLMTYQEKAGPQVTRLARSADGRNWTKEPDFELVVGDHAGYMRIMRVGQRILGTSRGTGGSNNSIDEFAMWHTIGNPALRSSWVLDSRPLYPQEHATGPGWVVAWSTMAMLTWQGRPWAICQLFTSGKLAWPELGIPSSNSRRLVLAPLSADLRRFIGPAIDILPLQGSEAPESDFPAWRTVQAFTDVDGTIYIYYITSDDVYCAKVV